MGKMPHIALDAPSESQADEFKEFQDGVAANQAAMHGGRLSPAQSSMEGEVPAPADQLAEMHVGSEGVAREENAEKCSVEDVATAAKSGGSSTLDAQTELDEEDECGGAKDGDSVAKNDSVT